MISSISCKGKKEPQSIGQGIVWVSKPLEGGVMLIYFNTSGKEAPGQKKDEGVAPETLRQSVPPWGAQTSHPKAPKHRKKPKMNDFVEAQGRLDLRQALGRKRTHPYNCEGPHHGQNPIMRGREGRK